jgi:hypothetical protein
MLASNSEVLRDNDLNILRQVEGFRLTQHWFEYFI